jgi:hypothetical protein
MIKNKKGWIRIVEAFTMILILTGVFLIILNKNPSIDFSQEIYEKEKEILMDIQLNNSLRESVLSPDIENLPIELSGFSADLKNKIDDKTPNDLECGAKICILDDECILSNSVEKDTYTQEVIITSTLSTYSPRKLKLFCWEK